MSKSIIAISVNKKLPKKKTLSIPEMQVVRLVKKLYEAKKKSNI